MLPPNNSNPTKTQRRKAATDSLDRSALPSAMPTNAATSAIIAGAAMAPPSPLLRPSPSANAKVDTKAEIANACTNSSLPRLSVWHAGDDENSRRAVDESGCQTDQRTKHGLRAARDFEVDADEANQGIDHENPAKQCGGQANIRLGEDTRRRQRSKQGTHQHRPQAPK
jgi:hypothetical protein